MRSKPGAGRWMGVDELCGLHVSWDMGNLCEQGPGLGALEQLSVGHFLPVRCGV
jgi:hypothetical protein